MKASALLLILLKAVWVSPAGAQATRSMPYPAFDWPSKPPADCPFERSTVLSGITFTGRHREYARADNWVFSWGADGHLYSPWTDGSVTFRLPGGQSKTITCWGAPAARARTGYAQVVGDDPLNLEIVMAGTVHAPGTPYDYGYPSGNLFHNGVWYLGTHVEGPNGFVLRADNSWYPWPWIGPFLGFHVSKDKGQTWTKTPHSPLSPMFAGDGLKFSFWEQWRRASRIGEPYFVDFGRDLEHSPDGKAYLVAHGSGDVDPGKLWLVQSSWCIGDQAYLLRVVPSPKTINDPSAYEFFAGHDPFGAAIWTRDIDRMKPLIEWKGRVGLTTMTYNPYLRRYLFCVTDGKGDRVGKGGGKTHDTYILESESITGPWRLVVYMEKFGEQAYFVNFPSKFLGKDGHTAWLVFAANYVAGHKSNPPFSRYGMCVHEIKLRSTRVDLPGPGEQKSHGGKPRK